MHSSWQNRILRQALLILLIFATGWFVGSQAGRSDTTSASADLQILRAPSTSFKFIKPLVGFDFADQQDFPELESLRLRMTKFINDQKAAQKNLTVSVYFRYFENGHWLGINENEAYSPGSLLKVPIMIAYFKKAEVHPEILNKKIYYGGKEDTDAEVNNPLKSSLVSGQSYSVEELIKAMAIFSDNTAQDLLIANIVQTYLDEVFSDLGIPLPESKEYDISAKVYATFFRRLHNATFLDRNSSESALRLLSQTEYKNGLVAGVPSGINVSHKYGERGLYDDGRLVGVELHDCGIVYYPSHSYLICVMTKSRSVKVSEQIIQTISKIVYEAMPNIIK